VIWPATNDPERAALGRPFVYAGPEIHDSGFAMALRRHDPGAGGGAGQRGRLPDPGRIGAAALLAVALTLAGVAHAAAQTGGPALLDRVAWGAKPALAGMRPHRPYSIIVHHTGERQNPRRDLAAKLRGLQAFSQAPRKMAGGRTLPPWPDLPYHYYIGADGTIGEGRDVNFAGDTNTRYDTTGHVQVVLEGNFEIEQPTAGQLAALKQVLRWQAQRWRVPLDRISVHKVHARTACPGKNLIAALPRVLAELQNGGP
jgi:hypothetical protein